MKKLILMIALMAGISTSAFAENEKPTKTVNLFSWLNKNLNYPTSASENREEGTVFVSFTISETGKTENVKIEAGASESLNNEALNAIKKMPLIGMYNSEFPNREFVLPIKFSIK